MMSQEVVTEAIHASTQEVFATMLGWQVSWRDAYTELKGPGPSSGIIAVVGLAGAWVGTASISCDSPLACRISTAMMGVTYTEINEEVLDVLSEIANMIVGNFKNTAELHLGPLGLSIPTVIYGFNFSARSSGKEKWVVVPFICDGDTFEVKMCLTPNRGLPHLPTASLPQMAAQAS